jgi:hypothetical protein
MKERSNNEKRQMKMAASWRENHQRKWRNRSSGMAAKKTK